VTDVVAEMMIFDDEPLANPHFGGQMNRSSVCLDKSWIEQRIQQLQVERAISKNYEPLTQVEQPFQSINEPFQSIPGHCVNLNYPNNGAVTLLHNYHLTPSSLTTSLPSHTLPLHSPPHYPLTHYCLTYRAFIRTARRRTQAASRRHVRLRGNVPIALSSNK